MYKVVKFFTDLQDNSHPYNVGDVFPRKGKDVTEKRLEELASSKNKRRVPLIEYVEDPKGKQGQPKNLKRQKEEPEQVNEPEQPEQQNEPGQVQNRRPRGRKRK